MTRIGDVIGNHRVTAEIGVGETGTVYRAEHTVIGRHVAIKFLRPEFSQSREIISRFFAELRKITAVDHPSIVELFDFGYHAGSAYVVMEYLEYETLEVRLRRGRIPVEVAVRFARQMGGALAAAHEHDALHRDLKPDNIVLVPDSTVPSGERVKLLDFGVHALLTDPRTGARKPGGERPAYLAPEQLQRGAEIGARTDLYALGCIWFEMLAGRPPFIAEADGELIAQHIYGEPPPLRELVPSASPPLADLVMRLLAKNPAERIASAPALVDAIDALGDFDVAGATTEHRVPVKLSFDKSVPAVSGAGSRRASASLFLLLGAAAVLLVAVALVLALFL